MPLFASFGGLCFLAELQVSVAGSKKIVAKIEVLPQHTAAIPPIPALPAASFFLFNGPDAEKDRETFTKALPKFPFPADSPPLSDPTVSLSPTKPSARTNTASPPPKQSETTSRIASPGPNASGLATDRAVEESVLSSTSNTKQLRDRRIALLRRDEKLRTAYHDLVIAPPHIFSDEDFWQSYAWESPSEADVVIPAENLDGPISAATAVRDPSSATHPSNSTAGLLDDEEAQKSIENEITDFSGFFDLLSRSLVDDRLKLSLTPALKKQIYEEFPMVRVAFDSKVPSTMTAAEFWTVFFKAQLDKLLRIREEKKAQTVKNTRKKATKKTAAKPAPEATAAPKKLTEEERQLAFFEKLTEATPAHLEKLVWQSRASDAISKDPSQNKVSQRGSLISVLAEDDAVSGGRNSENAVLLAASLNSSHITPPTKSRFITESSMDVEGDEEQQGSSTRENMSISKRASASAAVLAKQQDALKHRISLISRGVRDPSAAQVNQPDDPALISSLTGPSATITAEEMLFSALQDQAATEARTSRAKISAGQQSVLDSWQASAAKDGGIEVLDGIIVEEGELDDDSWTELKREKDRRSRHLQLIRKFNRHGHIIVSATSNDDEPLPQQESRNDPKAGETHQKYAFLSQKVDSGYHNQEFGAEVNMDVDEAPRGNHSASSSNPSHSGPLSDDTKIPRRVVVKREDGSTEVQVTTLNDVYALWPSLSRPAEPQTRKEPSLSAVSNVLQEMSDWSATVKRLRRPTNSSLDLPSNEAPLDYDLSGVDSMLEKVDQWLRHFWNLMERAGASSNRSNKFDFYGSEKLAPIVSQLTALLGSIYEMSNFLATVLDENGGHTQPKNSNLSKAIFRLQKKQNAVNRVVDLYEQLNAQ